MYIRQDICVSRHMYILPYVQHGEAVLLQKMWSNLFHFFCVKPFASEAIWFKQSESFWFKLIWNDYQNNHRKNWINLIHLFWFILIWFILYMSHLMSICSIISISYIVLFFHTCVSIIPQISICLTISITYIVSFFYYIVLIILHSNQDNHYKKWLSSVAFKTYNQQGYIQTIFYCIF